MMNQTDLQINKIAQGVIELRDGIDWFVGCELETKKEILQSLSWFLAQAHPTREEICLGIDLSGLKLTSTPCVLMMKKPFKEALGKILMLPENEWEKSFMLWIAILGVADKRRRETDCCNGCIHEWHNL
jgi:Family of unknown function (DUF5958)